MWIRGRGLRQGRSENDEDEFKYDNSKELCENVREILTVICKRQNAVSEKKRLNYLNSFVKVVANGGHDYYQLGFNAEEILYCLRAALLHDTAQVRSGGLRALRYMLKTTAEAAICYKLQYPLLVARSLDLLTGSDNERVQAIRVVRRLLCLEPSQFPVALVRALIAIATGTEDRFINVALATICELSVLNPELFISAGGVTAVLRSLSNVRTARMAEALMGSLLYLQNKPGTRLKAGLSLDCLAAPYTDLQSSDKTKESQGLDKFKWPHATLLSTLRSWPGTLHFCHPLKDGLRSIVATLYLNQLDVRKAVLDLLYELLCLAQPEWSDEMSVALEAVDPSRTQDAFKVTEGFVAAEGRAVLPQLSKYRVNLTELHLSLLLYCFLEVGLLDGIVEVIVAEDTFLSVRATILLGELLHLIHLLLPPECCNLTPALPNLLSYAVRGRPHSNTPLAFPNIPSTPQSSVLSNMDLYFGAFQDLTAKKDVVSMRMGVRSGHSSVRTVSESSTDKPSKQDVIAPNDLSEKRFGIDEDSPYNSERREFTDPNKQKFRVDPTSHLLKDVREVLADMTNTSDTKSPIKTTKRRKMSEPERLVTGCNDVEPPACSRAQQRALAAVTALSRLHRLLRLRPAPASIHLDHVLASVTKRAGLDGLELARAKGKKQSRNKLNQVLTKECDEAIKDSQVLTNKDCFLWNWDIIKVILKSRPDCLRKCEESNHRQFMRRLVQFVLPTSRQMSRVDFSTDRRTFNMYTLTAMELLDCLMLGQEDSENEKLLIELLTAIKVQFEAIYSSRSVHDCMFNPQAVSTTLCQDYFLLVGHLSRSTAGCDLLDKLGILQVLLVLVTQFNQDVYVKLIISSLDYSSSEKIRNVMVSALSSEHLNTRLYAIKFLRVLLRTPLSKRGDYAKWVIELLTNNLSDEKQEVVLNAVAALDEACDCKEYLDALINLGPSLLHLGDKGLLLHIRFFSTEEGFRIMSEANLVSTQLAKWVRYNYKYVVIVEGKLADGLSLVEPNEDGRYGTRLSQNKRVPSDVYVPPHLYGQLAQTSAGLTTVLADENVNKLVQVVLQGRCGTDSEILDLKAALWALGHLSTSPGGALWARANSVTRAMVRLASHCRVYSIRSTAFSAIALTSTNSEGADTLRALGWNTVRHNRNQRWPVVPPLSLLEDALTQYHEEKYFTRDSSESTTTTTGTDSGAAKNGLFILGEDFSMDGNESFTGFTARERAARERKSATLPPVGSAHTYHHNRSYSESKADSEWPPPAPSNSGSDITDFRSHENSRLYSESSTSGTSSCGDSSQPRTFASEKLMQTLSPIPSTGSLTTIRSNRRVSVASSQGPQLSPQDMVGYNTLRSLHRSRRPTFFASPQFSFNFSQSAPSKLSPISPIELIAFQDWKQMSPLVRPKHPDSHATEPQFEVTGVHCPLPSESQTTKTLHYESSRACIAQPPEDFLEEESSGPCYQGICLPQDLLDLFPMEEIKVKAQDPNLDNNSTTGMDVSSCDSETDTAPEGEAERSRTRALHKRRHDRSTCLLCLVSQKANTRQARWRKISASSQHRTRTETESSYGGAGNDGESPVMVQWHTKGGLEGITSVDSSSTDITSVAQRSLGDNFKSRSMVRKEVLRLAEQLCNPILYKTCKQALLQLKQLYGDVFNDICVYSDVCAIMNSAPYRILARRFLQELFLDAPFSEMYEDLLAILNNQNNTENDDGGCGEKLSTGSDAATLEDLTVDANNWKSAGPKTNGFDSDQRTVPGYELEVILENDARSESSDVCRGSGEGARGRSSTGGSRGSITPLEGKEFVKVEQQVQGETVQSPDLQAISAEAECHITVSRSSQQLRKEFFNAALSPEPKSNVEKESWPIPPVETKTAAVKNNESFVTKIADSISKSQGMLEPKLPTKSVKEEKNIQSSIISESASSKVEECLLAHSTNLENNCESQETIETQTKDLKVLDDLSDKQNTLTIEENRTLLGGDNRTTSSNPKNEDTGKAGKKGKKIMNQQSVSNESAGSIVNVNKSPQITKKGKKVNGGKVTNFTSKGELLPSKPLLTEQSTFNPENLNQCKENISSKLKNEIKLDSHVKNSESAKISNASVTGSDASTSKLIQKNVKSKLNETSFNSGKPPSGPGRQRKKATTKTPNRESLDSTSKKLETEKN